MTERDDRRFDLIESHCSLFRPPEGHSEQACGYFDVRDGWLDVIERLCVRIEGSMQDGETFRFVQLVQKFGLLQIDWEGQVFEGTGARIEEAVALAEARSGCTCEVCGAEGEKYHVDKIVMPRCDAHAEGRRADASSPSPVSCRDG